MATAFPQLHAGAAGGREVANDRKSQPGTSVVLAHAPEPIERAGPRFGAQAWTGVGDEHRRCSRLSTRGLGDGDDDTGAVWADGQRIVEIVVQDLLRGFRNSQDQRGGRRGEFQPDPLFLGQWLPDGESLGRDLCQINGDELLLFALSSGQAEQTVNYMLKSLSFRPSGIEWFSRIIGGSLKCFCGLVESEPQCRQWCTQLMGGVASEGLLRLDEAVESIGHRVEVTTQLPQLGSALIRCCARCEVAARELRSGDLQPPDWSSDRRGEQERNSNCRQQGQSCDHHEPADALIHATVEFAGRVGQANCAESLDAAENRYRDVQHRLP